MKVVAIVGKKKSGKTTLIEHLTACLKEHGKVGCIKHAHGFDLDMPIARDTDRFFTAGAEIVTGVSREKTLRICGHKDLRDLIEEMASSGVDFVLVEGFKSSDLPKISLNDFSHDEISNIVKHVDLKGDLKMPEETLKELVQFILASDDY